MARTFLPINLVFSPNWWHKNYDISFDYAFYFDKDYRLKSEQLMEQVINERFPFIGNGSKVKKPIPAVGSRHVAGGFVMPAIFGCKVKFSKNSAPWVINRNMTPEEILAMEIPEIFNSNPIKELIELMDSIEADFGYILGDFNWNGLFNTALNLRGQQLYTDFYDNPHLVHHLFSVITDAIIIFTQYISNRTGSSSISVNRSIMDIDPKLFVHANCAICQISPEIYKLLLLPFEKKLANQLQPYGIHHCGENMHIYSKLYAETNASFFDVGWGSDLAICELNLPDAFLNIRLSPVRMLQKSSQVISADLDKLLSSVSNLENVGVCCINMDWGTRDENINAIYDVVNCYRH